MTDDLAHESSEIEFPKPAQAKSCALSSFKFGESRPNGPCLVEFVVAVGDNQKDVGIAKRAIEVAKQKQCGGFGPLQIIKHHHEPLVGSETP